MTDPSNYNARAMSKSTVDRVIATNFQCRKGVQVAKMRNIPFFILKIDFHYKLPPKIKVWFGRGKSFAPFVCGVTIQNEDAQTVFWKFLRQSESMSETLDDLKRPRKRGQRLGCEAKACCVDNCCTVRGEPQEVFPGIEVKLDVFHWVSRWEGILYDPKSEKAKIFLGLLRKVLFVVERPEYTRVQFFLRQKGNGEPTVAEILKKAKGTTPPVATLKPRMDSLLRFVCHSDVAADFEDATTPPMTGPKQKKSRFFKPRTAAVNKDIHWQMTHITNNCLSDPPDHKVAIHRVNPNAHEAFTGRSAGTCEADHRQLNRLLNAPSVGVMRGERCCWDHYEESNERKEEKRCGKEKAPTAHSEKLYFVNSAYRKAGHGEDEMPVKASYPPTHDFEEHIGMDYELPKEFRTEQPAAEEVINGDEDDNGETDNDLANFLAGVDFEEGEDDIRVDADQFDPANQDDGGDAIMDDVEPIEVADVEAENRIEQEVERFPPKIVNNETTFEAFCRLTKEQPWVPLKNPSDTDRTELDREEADLFEKLETEHELNRSADINSRRGHKRFAGVWDLEVANRFKAKFESTEEEIVLVHRETCRQLQDCYDQRLGHLQRAELVRPNDPLRQNLESDLRNTRRSMPVTQVPVQTNAAVHNSQLGEAPFGRPTTLNTAIAACGVTRGGTSHAPFVLPDRRTATPSANPLGPNFRRNKCCWRCGFQKVHHNRSGVPFGERCENNCNHEECSKCLERIEFHARNLVGPYCTKAPHINSKCDDWYKETNNN